MIKNIPGTDGSYSCDEFGNVYRNEKTKKQTRRLSNGVIKDVFIKYKFRKVNPYRAKNGYYVFTMDKKTTYYHYVVALSFIGERPKKYTINHKNGIKTDNRVENLEYVTYKYNNDHAVKIGLNSTLISDFIKRSPVVAFKNGIEVARFRSAKDAEKELGASHVACICKGIRHSSNGYTFKYDEKMKLTKNFDRVEFDSKDGSQMPDKIKYNITRLANYLQIIRDHLDVPITVNSGYRSPEHNKSIGGSDGSKHMEGIAADIVVEGYTPDQVFEVIEALTEQGKLPNGGMKAYSTFTHWDYRGWNARW